MRNKGATTALAAGLALAGGLHGAPASGAASRATAGAPASGAASRASALAAVAASAPTILSAATIGGSGDDTGRAIAVDRRGNLYVTGETTSRDFPVTGVPRRAPTRARVAAFVAKFDAHGRLVYATVLGGSRYSAGRGIAVDGAGRAYVAGATSSTDFPTTRGALQRSYGGGPYDAFVSVLSPSGRRLEYSTFLGDTHYDEANAIAVDRRGRAVVTGKTASPQFPRAGRLQPPVDGGAFVAKLDRTGSKLVFSAVFGGDERGDHGNTGFGVAVDATGATVATGVTDVASFPVVHALQGILGGGGDAFVVKIDPAGRRVVYSTYLGGGGDDAGRAVATDAAGNAYVAGVTASIDFPGRGPQVSEGGAADAFVAKLDPSGRTLAYATRLGGSGDDDGDAIALDARGGAYLAGRTASTNFPLRSAARRSGTAFVSRLARNGATLPYSTRLGPAAQVALGAAVAPSGAVAVTGQSTTRDGANAFVRLLAPRARPARHRAAR